MLEIILIVLILGLDQYAKHLTDIFLSPVGTTIPIIQDVFHLTSTHNTGAAFGIFAGGRWFFMAVSLLACAFMLYLLFSKRFKLHLLLRICLSLIVAGALGNLVDRVMLGYVRDMFYFVLINFAIFNVADSAVVVGGILLAYDLIFGKNRAFYDQIDKPSKSKAVKNTKEQSAAVREAQPEAEDADEQP